MHLFNCFYLFPPLSSLCSSSGPQLHQNSTSIKKLLCCFCFDFVNVYFLYAQPTLQATLQLLKLYVKFLTPHSSPNERKTAKLAFKLLNLKSERQTLFTIMASDIDNCSLSIYLLLKML